MPILPNIGRRSLKMRSLIVLMHTLLIAGSLSMLYPFLIMLSGSVKGNADIDEMDVVPKIAYSESMRFSRFEEDRYMTLTNLSAAYGEDMLKFSSAALPNVDMTELRRFEGFLKAEASDLPDHFYLVQEMGSGADRVRPRNFRKFRNEILRECNTLGEFNRRYRAALSTWNSFPTILDVPLTKEFNYTAGPLVDRYLRFKRSRPLPDKVLLNVDGYFLNNQRLLPEVKNGDVKSSPTLSATCPQGKAGLIWADFVKHNLNCLFVKLDPDGLKLFRKFVAGKYVHGVGEMNRINETHYPSMEDIEASCGELRNSGMFSLYTDFVTNVCPARYLIVDTPSTRYRAYVRSRTVTAPYVAYDYSVYKKTAGSFLLEAATRNYRSVIQYLAVYGRAVLNTVVFIGLSILAALTVNPLAAYALSRFNLKSTYTILMFFLATMAFPGAVTMIPNFLLLKKLHLLNTFWALVLPGLANGYSIFILKGFFDSIPREIYESAIIDGASEWTMFWKFTMALSKPILALVTLGAFTAAYTAFMFALIICPDEKMWTLMVWLYQIQMDAHQGVVYAALVLALIPTLLVFVFAQNTIMKGIVIPVEK